ncbi:signal transduction histidine kinase [Pelomonas saccharophila]|uniref:histidine kinase n=1 Tax=Roseateles saccharophilus TaxID=304 RepID=A0ABU1YP44_ROSSA|nr:ATP-binding protein [Roseateles saccharophilus]MDR7270622.1 signal transduction histidine kinase [Roseateles saccharophilus]
MAEPQAPLPTIARRLLWVTGLGSLLVALTVTAAAVLTVDAEVDELLDDGLKASAAQLAPLLLQSGAAPQPSAHDADDELRFAWAWFDAGGRLVRASPGATVSWQPVAPGFAHRDHWRLYGLSLRGGQGLLVVAQTRAERKEVRVEVASYALLAALALAALGLPLLAWRSQRELRPLQRLAEGLARFDATRDEPGALAAQLGPPARAELQPIHDALRQIGERLGERLALEREFTAQSAHLLRTPLAGMDAQLAVALKEQPDQPRLQRVREASRRLQHLLLALLRLFRSTPELRRVALDARTLLAGLPLGSLQLQDGPPCPLDADAELLAAALLNLVDNAQRHGATRLWLSQPLPGGLLLVDDGTGLGEAEKANLRSRLASGSTEQGLGLRLAQLVARAHGGELSLPDCAQGFAVQLLLGR